MVMGYTDVHVLNVGRGSCAVVESPSGRATMIDINDGGKLRPNEYEAIDSSTSQGFVRAALRTKKEQMLDDPIDWYRRHVGSAMWRFILTHPDKDHMSGIRHLLSGESGIAISNFWDYDHDRTRTEKDYPSNPAGWLDWQWYYGFHVEASWDGVAWPKRIHPLRGDVGNFWTDDSFQILSPTTTLIDDCDKTDVYNNASYVIKINHGPTNRLLAPGDVEDKAWNDMIDAGVNMRADVLIASHHGRNSGFHEGALERIRPQIVIISSDEIPAEHDAIDRYRELATVFSTREHGTITVRMHDGGIIQVIDRDGRELTRLWDKAA
jgi:beta-lactamase superfamily II metal-dependent hydrolase